MTFHQLYKQAKEKTLIKFFDKIDLDESLLLYEADHFGRGVVPDKVEFNLIRFPTRAIRNRLHGPTVSFLLRAAFRSRKTANSNTLRRRIRFVRSSFILKSKLINL